MTSSINRSIFLCYSVRDRSIASRFASGLEQQLLARLGYPIDVWWDLNRIPVGADWEDYLSQQVSNSVCAVVLWTKQSVKSEWVLRESEIASRRSALVPVLIEDVSIPDRFSRIQSLAMIGWDGNSSDPGFRRLVEGVWRFIETAPSAAEETKVLKKSERLAARRAEDLFRQNLRYESTVEYIQLERTPFYDQLSWNLNPGINVLLGRNGYGKTYLLRAMLSLLQYEDDIALQLLGDGGGTASVLTNGDERLIHFSEQYFDEEGAVGKLPVLAIPDLRFVNRSSVTLSAVADETTGVGDRADLGAYGAWHFLREKPYESMVQSFLYGLCLDFFEDNREFRGEQFNLIRSVVRDLTDQTFEFERVAREGRDRFTLYVRTEGNHSNPLPVQKASQGTMSVIAIIGLIYDFLKSLRQASTPEVSKRSGIIIIDELDAHLHPFWQQKIVSLLRDRFPRAQFIITAHNPITVAGCLEDEVSVLRKTQDGGFSLVQFPNDFIGWQPDEIYRKVFEIEDPDETFTLYDAMRPFKTHLEEQAADLAKRPTRNEAEDRTLDDIEEKLLHIRKVEQTRTKRISQEELERENRMLQDRLLGVESAHESIAQAQRELERVKAESQSALSRIERRLRHGRAVATALAISYAVGAVVLLTRLNQSLDSKILAGTFVALLVLPFLLIALALRAHP